MLYLMQQFITELWIWFFCLFRLHNEMLLVQNQLSPVLCTHFLVIHCCRLFLQATWYFRLYYSLSWYEFPPCFAKSFTMNTHKWVRHVFKQSERTFLEESMYLCKWRFAAKEHVDEQLDGFFFKLNVSIKTWGPYLRADTARRSCR